MKEQLFLIGKSLKSFPDDCRGCSSTNHCAALSCRYINMKFYKDSTVVGRWCVENAITRFLQVVSDDAGFDLEKIL
jgi:hypothetical protein